MIDTCYIRLSNGAVFAKGELPFSLSVQLGVTFDLAVAFVDDLGNIVALPEGSTGRFILKPLARFQSGPRFLMQAWSVQGEGAQRRYRFKAILDSRPLRNDFGNLTVKEYEVQIEYTTSGDVFASRPFACTVSNNYFQGNDSPPPLPLGGPEAVEFHAEIFPPTVAISSGTHYAGNVNRGGDLFNVRLSVDDYHAGATVQILINGTTELFTEPVLIEAQTNVWSQDDVVNLLAVSVIPSGARIDVVTVFAGGVEYPVAPTALEVDMSIRTTAQIEQEGYDWLKLRLPESEGYSHDDEAQVIAPPAGGVTDHGALTGLGDDDHTQYHTDARGDARYSQLGHGHAYGDLTGKPTLGTAAALDVGTTAGKVVQLDGAGKLPAVDGSQLTGISGGGGAALLHVTGMIQGHTTALVPATAPSCTIECAAWNGTGAVITISRNAETMLVTLDTTDPANGSVFLDTTSLSNPADFGPALNSALAAFSAEFTTAYDSDTKIITLTAVLTGGAISLNVSISGTTGLGTPTGTSGGDESPASGAIMSVELVAGVTGKIVYPQRVIVKSDLGVSVKLRDGNDNDLLPAKASTSGAWAEWDLDPATMEKFFQGTDEDTGLFFCFTDAATGGSATIYLIADQATAP